MQFLSTGHFDRAAKLSNRRRRNAGNPDSPAGGRVLGVFWQEGWIFRLEILPLRKF